MYIGSGVDASALNDFIFKLLLMQNLLSFLFFFCFELKYFKMFSL